MTIPTQHPLRCLAITAALALASCASAPDPAPAPAPAPQAEIETPPPQPVAQTPAPPPSADATSPFLTELALCPRTTISNRPDTNDSDEIVIYRPSLEIAGAKIAMAPIEAGCFSSGFGQRPRLDGSSRLHKGVDFYHPDAVDIYAAGDGVVREALYRDDYGKMIVIDHGGGVYTRYAHLETIAAGVGAGVEVDAGDVLGLMGNTASYSIPRHLHYEVLQGNYDTPAKSFGLTPLDIFKAAAGG